MFLLKYAVRQIYRSIWRCLVVVMITFIFTLIINISSNAGDVQRVRLKDLYDNFRVNCVVSDIMGIRTNDLMILDNYIEACTNKANKFSSYIRDVYLKRTLTYKIDSEQLDMTDIEPEEAMLVGITCLKADDRLLPENGAVVSFYEGYDESILLSKEPVCIISKELLSSLNINESNELKLTVTDEFINFEGKKPAEAVFKIIGTITGASKYVIYCPWNIISELGVESVGIIYTQSMSFTISDNRRLGEFKEKAETYFSSVDITSSALSGFALTVHDGSFIKSSVEIKKNIQLMEVLLPVILVLSTFIGFFASLLFTRNKKHEFAVMRSLGTGRGKVLLIAFIEQLILTAVGFGFGITALFIISISINILNSFILMLCFIIGTFVAVIKTTSVNVSEIMKVKE